MKANINCGIMRGSDQGGQFELYGTLRQMKSRNFLMSGLSWIQIILINFD
jgi:hypothetical protein